MRCFLSLFFCAGQTYCFIRLLFEKKQKHICTQQNPVSISYGFVKGAIHCPCSEQPSMMCKIFLNQQAMTIIGRKWIWIKFKSVAIKETGEKIIGLIYMTVFYHNGCERPFLSVSSQTDGSPSWVLYSTISYMNIRYMYDRKLTWTYVRKVS